MRILVGACPHCFTTFEPDAPYGRRICELCGWGYDWIAEPQAVSTKDEYITMAGTVRGVNKKKRSADPIEIAADNPIWRDFDDDWAGAACSNYIQHYLVDREVILRPPEGIHADLLFRVCDAISRVARSVRVEE